MITCSPTCKRYTYICLSFFFLSFQLTFFDYTMNMDFLAYNDKISSIYMMTVYVSIGWLFKFIPAMLSDIYESRGLSRKTIIIVAYLSAFFPLLVLSGKIFTLSAYVAFLLLFITLLSIADVNMDAYIVQETKHDDQAGNLIFTLSTLSRELGSILGDSTGPLSYTYLGSKQTYIILSITLFFSVFIFTLYPEREKPVRVYSDEARVNYETNNLNMIKIMKKVFAEFRSPQLKYLIMHLYFVHLLPTPRLAMFYYYIGPMGFTPEKMSLLSIIIGMIRLFFIAASMFISKMKIRNIYIICGGCAFFCSFAPLLLSFRWDREDIKDTFGEEGLIYLPSNTSANQTFCLAEVYGLDTLGLAVVDDGIGSIFESFRSMTLLRLISLLSEPSIEASALAIGISMLNFTIALQRMISSSIIERLNIKKDNFTNLSILLFICCGAEFISYVSGDFIAPDKTIKEIADNEPIDVTRQKIMEKRQNRFLMNKKIV